MATLTRRMAPFLCMAAVLAGCAPALNWRDVRPEGSGVQALFPCKPDVEERRVALAGPPVRWALNVCTAGDQSWALAHADVVEPGRVGPALAALQAGAAANLGVRTVASTPQAVAGATPQAASGRKNSTVGLNAATRASRKEIRNESCVPCACGHLQMLHKCYCNRWPPQPNP